MATNNNATFLQWLRQRPPGSLSPQDVAYFIRQVTDELQPVHDQQVVHQCVTPASFFLRYNSERPDLPGLQLANFDRTKYSLTSNTRQSIVGVPGSMAPEQWQGTVLPTTDQYALAIMAYQLLTWQAPFQGDNEQLKYQHLNVQPRPPSTINPRIPAGLDAVILRALAKNPAARYPSISAFADAFQQAVQPSMPTLSPMPVSPASTPGVGSPRQLLDAATVSPPSVSSRVPATSAVREVIILAIVFLVVVSGIGFGFYAIVKNNSNAAANTTPTTQGTQNLTATATSDVLFTTVTGKTPLFTDSLASNDGDWQIDSNCVFSGSTYHALQSLADHATACALEMVVKGNVAIQVDVSVLAGSDAGIIFRLSSTGNQLQSIGCSITRQGAYYCVRIGSSLNILIPPSRNPAIRTGSQKNTLLVVAQGTKFRVYINDAFVGEAQDSPVASWFLGLVVRTSASDTHGDASFANFKLYPLK